MILGKYKTKKRLGRGAYGNVLLVEDDKGKQLALKLIQKKALQKQSYLIDYLKGQIECMKSINSPYIMKLYDTQQDETCQYLFCEYCDGGDLLNYQAKQPGRVFTLEKAAQVASQVIKGLYQLHQKGYLHRDIKSQNILVKNQNGKQTFKLADFGFSKKCDSICDTVLGTQTYMSPEIFRNQQYGYEVDMWAFGVLLYFMLNMEFPFKINPLDSLQRKQAKLQLDSKNFSYKKFVEGSKKKIIQNCTPQVEDLFKRIFNSKANQRIKFSQIRQHPLFLKYFVNDIQQSRILYGKQFKALNNTNKKQVQKSSQKQKNEQDNVIATHSVIRKKDKLFPAQKTILQTKKDQIDFLKDNAIQFYMNAQLFKNSQRCCLAFNLIKYYIILLRQFIDNLNDPNKLIKIQPNLKWKQFSQTKQYQEIKKQAEQDKLKFQVKFQQIYDQCTYTIEQISKINDKFKAAFDKEITQKSFQGSFKQSYRKSTHKAFNSLRQLMKNSKRSGNKLNYNLAILVISHVFNHIFMDSANMQTIFAEYFTHKNRTVKNIDYSQLREWMTCAKAEQLNGMARQIIQLYFQ